MHWDDLLRLLTLRDANTRVVLLGAGLLGLAAGVIGTFALLRRRALVGDAVAHASLPGVCIAFLIIGDRSFPALLAGALVIGALGAGLISIVRHATRIKEDAAIGIVIGGFFGLGVVLSRVIQDQPGGNKAGLDSFIFGKAASMVRADALTITIVAVVILLCVAILYKELKLLCFDHDFAASQGWPAARLDLLIVALLCICTVAGLPAVGIVLIVALLVIPPAAARFWTDRLGVMVAIAGGIGLIAGVLGTALSATIPAPAHALTRGWPTGPMIVLVATTGFIVSLVGAPRRGLAAAMIVHLRLRSRTALQHVLRSAYEHGERIKDFSKPWTRADLARASHHGLKLARRHGFISSNGDQSVLTTSGRAEAARVVRAHRLWELFLMEHAEVAADHVDRSADEIEHVLPDLLVEKLESRLAREGRLPATIPASPHPLNGGGST